MSFILCAASRLRPARVAVLMIATSSPGYLLIPKSLSNLPTNSMARCWCQRRYCEKTMKVFFYLMAFLLSSSVANAADQCPQCSAADLCIREYTRDTTKLKADHIRAIAAQRKGAGQTTPADQGNLSIQKEIDKLKDCLGKIH